MRIASLALISVAVVAAVPLGGCKFIEDLTGGSKQPAEKKSCVADIETVREMKIALEGDLPTRVQATLSGAVYLRELAEKLDKEVGNVCANLNRELGKGKAKLNDKLKPGERAKAACEETGKLIRAKREKDGIVMLIYPHAPMCTVGLDDYSRCVRQCDPNLPPDGSGIVCDSEMVSGRCSDKCEGVCLLSFSDSCEGVCRGQCKGGCAEEFYGKCGGKCTGTCDGLTKSGSCEGTCEGKCSADADGSCQGTCKGKCSGMCLTEAKKTECDGTCLGSCSEALGSERCGIALAPPEMLPACGAMCEAKLAKDLQCVAAHADVSVYNSTKKGAGDKLKGMLTKKLELLLGAGDGMKDSIDRAHEGVATSIASLQEAVESDATVKKKIGACVNQAEKNREESAAAIEAIREAVITVLTAVKG
jgi:hypothetical protein